MAAEVPSSSPPIVAQPPEPPKIADIPKSAEVPKVAAPPANIEPVPTIAPSAIDESIPAIVPPAIVKSKPEVKHPQAQRDLGRGGAQHQAIQQRIKREAEELGFRADIEKPLLEGQASADVWLDRDGQCIACEISITNTIDNEVRKIIRCLKAGISNVAVICLDEQKLRKMEAAISGSLGAELAQQVGYFHPDQFIASLKSLPRAIPEAEQTSQVRRGYKVKRVTAAGSPQEQKARDQQIIRVLRESMRRPK